MPFNAMQPHEAVRTESARRFYAEELCRRNGISSPAILAAFSAVPREQFIGPGPWLIQDSEARTFTQSSDPISIYQDALIVLDAAKHLNNGQPSLWAFHLSLLGVQPGDAVLHLGCGTGYYSAVLAELAGPRGRVVAVEIDDSLAARARIALAPWPQVTVLHADGARGAFNSADTVVVSAGATHPLPSWLAALKPGGKLLFPLTPSRGAGTMAYTTRKNLDLFSAALVGSVFFVEFEGARDLAIGEELSRALADDHGAGVRSLRRDPHQKDGSCWLHGNGWCFSRHAPDTLV
ncbi:MAG TPA: methyltransferase domain-containing protein [Terracidiphilus sp.]|jgi:protein-L-isoaspartate(D-aspartate) O-methyltransferase|nr:methyltransferase domain-containing protein [Terracidiphilus sp.]